MTEEDIARVYRTAEIYGLAPRGLRVLSRLHCTGNEPISLLTSNRSWGKVLGDSYDRSLFDFIKSGKRRSAVLTIKGRSVAARLLPEMQIRKLHRLAREYRLTRNGVLTLFRLYNGEDGLLLPSEYHDWRGALGLYHDRRLFAYFVHERNYSKTELHLSAMGRAVARRYFV